ncbi:MAG: hypothetical protein JXA93_24060 [Anaerolineae bacterium]|nr:hypothetical protein [Anaerolineae bacterium]
MENRTSLQDAINHLYQTAVVDSARTSTTRLQSLAEFVVEQLERRGLTGVEREVTIPGGGRPKQWDVAWMLHGKYRLAVSLKSILKNLGGTVPNRIDDLIGEVANAQMYSPEIVIGYFMVFNVGEDVFSLKHECTWCDLLTTRLERLSGRTAPHWSVGMLEGFVVVQVDFRQGPKLLTPMDDVEKMFDVLVAEVKARNPGLGL